MENTKEFRKVCKFIQKVMVPLKKEDGDERKEEEIEQEEVEKFRKICKECVEEISDDINREFDLLDKNMQKFVYAALTRGRKEMIYRREQLAVKLDYMKWIVDIEQKYECEWDDFVEIISRRKLKLTFPVHCKEIAKQNIYSILISKHKAKIIGEYKGKDIGINCICQNGHECCPVPSSILQGKGICKKCSDNFDENEKIFYDGIAKRKGRVLGKYKGQTTPVRCICENGHICYSVPCKLPLCNFMCRKCMFDARFENFAKEFKKRVEKWGGKLLGPYRGKGYTIECLCPVGHICYVSTARLYCRECNILKRQSVGELKLRGALQKLGFEPKNEYTPKILDKGPFRSLRFDAAVMIKNKTYLFEYHGSQHDKPKFDQTQEEFDIARQRDLVKIYVAKKEKNMKLIILDYKWVERSEKTWIDYLEKAIKNSDKIVAESPLHTWVHTDIPKKESIKQWTNY